MIPLPTGQIEVFTSLADGETYVLDIRTKPDAWVFVWIGRCALGPQLVVQDTLSTPRTFSAPANFSAFTMFKLKHGSKWTFTATTSTEVTICVVLDPIGRFGSAGDTVKRRPSFS